MPTTTTPNGTSIAYEVVGSGPSIVLLHGLTESRRTWDPLVAPLATEHTVVLVDLRPHLVEPERFLERLAAFERAIT